MKDDAAPSPWVDPIKAAQHRADRQAKSRPRPSVPETEPPPPEPAPVQSTGALPVAAAEEVPASETAPEGPARPWVLPFRTSEAHPLAPAEPWSEAAGEPAMTLPRYAAMCASCRAFPERVAETHAKFGIQGQAARLALDEAWRGRFEADPRLEELYRALLTRMSGWLTRYGAV